MDLIPLTLHNGWSRHSICFLTLRLDDSRWVKRALTWNAGGGRRGRSFDLWDAPVTKFCRWQNIEEWQVAAQDKVLWLQYLPDFITFMHL